MYVRNHLLMAFSVKISGLLRLHMTFVFICLSTVILINKKGRTENVICRYIYTKGTYSIMPNQVFFSVLLLFYIRDDVMFRHIQLNKHHVCRPGMYIIWNGVQVYHCFRKRCYIVRFVAMCSLFFTPM